MGAGIPGESPLPGRGCRGPESPPLPAAHGPPGQGSEKGRKPVLLLQKALLLKGEDLLGLVPDDQRSFPRKEAQGIGEPGLEVGFGHDGEGEAQSLQEPGKPRPRGQDQKAKRPKGLLLSQADPGVAGPSPLPLQPQELPIGQPPAHPAEPLQEAHPQALGGEPARRAHVEGGLSPQVPQVREDPFQGPGPHQVQAPGGLLRVGAGFPMHPQGASVGRLLGHEEKGLLLPHVEVAPAVGAGRSGKRPD